jgi:hypothetical protein
MQLTAPNPNPMPSPLCAPNPNPTPSAPPTLPHPTPPQDPVKSKFIDADQLKRFMAFGGGASAHRGRQGQTLALHL